MKKNTKIFTAMATAFALVLGAGFFASCSSGDDDSSGGSSSSKSTLIITAGDRNDPDPSKNITELTLAVFDKCDIYLDADSNPKIWSKIKENTSKEGIKIKIPSYYDDMPDRYKEIDDISLNDFKWSYEWTFAGNGDNIVEYGVPPYEKTRCTIKGLRKGEVTVTLHVKADDDEKTCFEESKSVKVKIVSERSPY